MNKLLNTKAWSLLETLLCLSILSILWLLAIPSWRSFSQQQRSQFELQQLVQALQFARINAMQTQQRVQVCGSSDNQHADGNWSRAYIIINTTAKTPRLIRSYPRPANAGLLHWQAALGQACLQFSADGSAIGYNGQFRYQAHPGANVQTIIVSPTGRIRTVDE